jgi:hypothetical protein
MEGLVQIFVKGTSEVVLSFMRLQLDALLFTEMRYNFAAHGHAKATASLAHWTVSSHEETRPTTAWILTKFGTQNFQSCFTLAYWI